MTTLEQLEEYNVIEKKDISNFTDLLFNKIHFVDFNIGRVEEKEFILNFVINLLEGMLNTSSILSKKDKLSIIHILSKFKLQQEIIEISKKSLSDEQFLANLKEASIHLGKKSQSAFELK